MNFMIQNIAKNSINKEIFSSIVVFLVALPLCLGVAIASGLDPIYGILTGIIGGIITGVFAGCPLQISGPAGGLIVVVIEIVHNFGIEKLGIIVLFAGLLQIFIGVTGLAPWFQIVSPAIIRGMLSAIGVIIFASQFHIMLDNTPYPGTIDNLWSIPKLIWKILAPQNESTYHIAAGIGLITLLGIMLWEVLPYKKVKQVPASLIAVVLASCTANFMNLPVDFVEIPDNPLSGIGFINLKLIPEVLSSTDTLIAIFGLAFIASVEAILSTKAMDNFLPLKDKTKHGKELVAQGLGNACAGLINSLPLTGVIVRSFAAFNSGGRTNLVAILHGVWLLLTLFIFKPLINLIPLASLAAILVYISVKLIDIDGFKKIYQVGKSEFIICLITFVMVIFTNIFEGVLIGIVLSGIKLLYQLSKFKSVSLIKDSNEIEIYLNGTLNFVNLPKLDKMLSRIPHQKNITFNSDNLESIDHCCIEAIEVWSDKYSENGGKIAIEWTHLNQKFCDKN